MHHLLLGLAVNPSLPSHLIDRFLAYEDVCLEPLDCELAQTLGDRSDLSREQAKRLVSAHEDCATVSMSPAVRVLTEADVDPVRWPLVALALLEEGAGNPSWARHLAEVPEYRLRESLAALPGLPDDVTGTLAADPDVRVVAELALWTTSTTTATRLARHPHAEVRGALALNPLTPPPVLAALITGEGLPPVRHCPVCDQEPVPYTRASGSERPGCEPRSGAACDGSHRSTLHELLVRVLENRATPTGAALAFADDGRESVRRALATRHDLPATAYELLARDPSHLVRYELAGNPAICEAAVRVLAVDLSPEVRRTVAHHPRLPLDVLTALTGTVRTGPVLLPRIAEAPPAEIALLAASPDPAVRALVAERHDLPEAIRDRLAADPDAKVAKAVAPHPGLPEAALRAMTTRFGAQVAGRVAENPDAPPAFLEELALRTPPVRKVLRAVAARPDATPASLVACLADSRVRITAARHPSLPPDVLTGLLDHADHDLASAAAANPALPVGEMTRLLPPPVLPRLRATT
ncbi:hypothetical protein OHA55_02980 [Streptomyces sp. NBC_00102]|nr:hypothetical protein [Streptomyces sp. NBC_00102]